MAPGSSRRSRLVALPTLGALSALILLSGVVVGASWVEPGAPARAVPDWSREVPFLRILLTNASVGLLLVCGGFSLGVITGLTLIYNGLLWGAQLARSLALLGTGRTSLLVLPHGVLEVTGLVVLAASGFRVAAAMAGEAREPDRGSRLGLEAEVRDLGRAVGAGFLLILAGAIVESWVTVPLAGMLDPTPGFPGPAP